MKTTSILFLIILIHFSVAAQFQPKGLHLHKPINMASILTPKSPSLINSFSSISEARTIISDIMNVVNQQPNFQVVSTAQIDNAAAVTYQGQRYILYNPSFINQLDNAADDQWASISVLAHEIGHHLLGHTMDGAGSQRPKELGADEFSGLVLKRMGASLYQSQLAMRLISSPQGSATHPGEGERLAAIAKGWNGTNLQVDRGRDVAIDPTEKRNDYPTDRRQNYPPADNSSRYPSNGREYPSNRGQQYPQQRNRGNSDYPARQGNAVETIVYAIKFNGSRSAQYFITSQNNIIKYNGVRAQMVAKITQSNRAQYPYIIYDDQQQLYVDRVGNIFSNRGQNVGVITRA